MIEDNEMTPKETCLLFLLMLSLLFSVFIVLSKDDSGEYTTSDDGDYRRICIDGKEFIRAYRMLTIDLDFDGKPIPCWKEKKE